ncbi:single-strand selective monofunctional uracil DNA glycosylase-like [Strongylocentrotus purpuratus]|uniref:Single-strand selective monofunctional uracil DNA glycosylase n=1 Tax=Strongylocentrotus purpuratus TaxID=7668 RepID=A0A7M7HJB0_STRPU|nr:single-strand selective monofunctional uracil DNA glycosylase-like [Strongylocentrotus purpuratus]|eukprot:XP_011681742.1 PREDICTED: single-strand selective monofunctional uracil DNA glycosylase-like [Strongylocentrotus purpuratus]
MADGIIPQMENMGLETVGPSGDDPATPVTTPSLATSDLPTAPANFSGSATTRPSGDKSIAERFISLVEDMVSDLKKIKFDDPVRDIFNPVVYAKEIHDCFIRKYCNSTKSVLFLGMNPGPSKTGKHTGVPFADTETVKGWMEITAEITADVGGTQKESPKGGPRSGVSGKRFWKLCKGLCDTPEKFFDKCFVYDYCPLIFLGENGKNVTPSDMKADMKNEINGVCDDFLRLLIRLLDVKVVVNLGNWYCI